MCQGGADMDKKEIRSSNILFLLKCLLFSYILTGGFLLLLALFLYKFQLSEKVVSIAIIGIYVVAVFFAGFMTGKRMGSKKISVGACGRTGLFCGYGSGIVCGQPWI